MVISVDDHVMEPPGKSDVHTPEVVLFGVVSAGYEK